MITREDVNKFENEHCDEGITGEHCCEGIFALTQRLLAERDEAIAEKNAYRELAIGFCETMPMDEAPQYMDKEVQRILKQNT